MSNSAEPVAAEPKTAAAIAAKAVASSPQEKAAQHKSTDDNAVVKGGPEPADGKRRGKRRGNAKKNVEKDQQGEGGKQNKGDRQQRKRRDDWFKIDFDALDVEGVTLAELEAAVDKLKKNEVKKPDFSALKERTDKLQSKIESYKAQLVSLSSLSLSLSLPAFCACVWCVHALTRPSCLLVIPLLQLHRPGQAA